MLVITSVEEGKRLDQMMTHLTVSDSTNITSFYIKCSLSVNLFLLSCEQSESFRRNKGSNEPGRAPDAVLYGV